MTNEVLKTITSSVKYECSSTALEDVSSAVAVSLSRNNTLPASP